LTAGTRSRCLLRVFKTSGSNLGKVLKEADLKPPLKCLVGVEKGKIILKPLPKMADRGFGIFKVTEPFGDVDEIIKKAKLEI